MAKAHLYNSRIGKVRWFVERFGARELFLKPLRSIFAPLIISTLKARSFRFEGVDLPLLYHPYNMTWASERCVEVPIVQSYTRKFRPEKTLEVGNVLAHYVQVQHDVVDKFEKAPGVINEDVVAFRGRMPYDLIVSISTFEHIGFDDESSGRSAEKILEAIRHCRQLLSEEGLLVITVPMGYNPELNSVIAASELQASKETYLKKQTAREWVECTKDDALRREYKRPHPYANAILVAQFRSLR